MDVFPRPRPIGLVLEGHYVRLEPLRSAHTDGLFAASADPARFAYLFAQPPRDVAELRGWVETNSGSDDPLFFAVIDRATGIVGGRQALMRIVPEHGVVEIGNILWGPDVARTRLATEAIYLTARHLFDDLGYRRFEWKCDDRNQPSKAAAERFGFRFEGLFHQHMWVKGRNRDTAWFAMLDKDWPSVRAAFERWLDPANFDGSGHQRARLEARAAL